MIVKILTRHNPTYYSLIRYILRDGKSSQVFTHNLRSNNENGYVQEFLENEALRKHPRKGSIYMYHEIISLHNGEDKAKITDAMLKNLAEKYISLRGKQGIYVGSVHRDKEHIHIHFCSSGTEFRTGKAFRLSKDELNKLKVSFQSYHVKKFPELTKSAVRHRQKNEYATNKEWQLKHRDERKSIKEQIMQTVSHCFANASNQKDFLESLRDNNIHFYERGNVPTGIIYENIKIRFSRLNISFDHLQPGRTEEERSLSEIKRMRTNRQQNKKIIEKGR